MIWTDFSLRRCRYGISSDPEKVQYLRSVPVRCAVPLAPKQAQHSPLSQIESLSVSNEFGRCPFHRRRFCPHSDRLSDVQVNELLNGGHSVIRNFAIIAHIDHGKSTLSDRLLEHCGNIKHKVSIRGENAQSLDTLSVERERGITVKAQGASLFYRHRESGFMLNLIDTPGHVDFAYEVSRSLTACQAVLLLIDSSQGIQAQTIAVHEMATLKDLVIIPVLTKVIDAAFPENVRFKFVQLQFPLKILMIFQNVDIFKCLL